jgi:ribosomal protein L12E/L44/L45/RPP1/RPP2
MAKNTAAVLDESLDEAEVELTPKQIINTGITQVLESSGIDVQHSRYKAMRAIAYQAFVNAIEDGSFDELVEQAIANADDLPSGWELERAAKVEAEKPAPKAVKATKAPAKKATAKSTSTTTKARRRPTR